MCPGSVGVSKGLNIGMRNKVTSTALLLKSFGDLAPSEAAGEYLLANLMAIGSCSLLNFLASNTLVFQVGIKEVEGT